jgi:hypothetical protein
MAKADEIRSVRRHRRTELGCAPGQESEYADADRFDYELMTASSFSKPNNRSMNGSRSRRTIATSKSDGARVWSSELL